MDPNETLRRLRFLLTEANDEGAVDLVPEIAGLFRALDASLSANGSLPDEWERYAVYPGFKALSTRCAVPGCRNLSMLAWTTCTRHKRAGGVKAGSGSKDDPFGADDPMKF